ncbi:protein of unknown function [Candidatus Nitrosacidococcus tergens]|uniref:Uncharacterized protein n=1 Tax=Candidatus Nitrosacidococcus tergens TaxID=553981 RepID=A0A7G1Q7M2_9GAMM|nr:protein of unknown function [Candidatus Nitrosacidococcus tergens]
MTTVSYYLTKEGKYLPKPKIKNS